MMARLKLAAWHQMQPWLCSRKQCMALQKVLNQQPGAHGLAQGLDLPVTSYDSQSSYVTLFLFGLRGAGGCTSSRPEGERES